MTLFCDCQYILENTKPPGKKRNCIYPWNHLSPHYLILYSSIRHTWTNSIFDGKPYNDFSGRSWWFSSLKRN